MTLLNVLTLTAAIAAPDRPTIPTTPTVFARTVNLVVNPGFENGTAGWKASAGLSYIVPPPYGDPNVRQTTPMSIKGPLAWGRSGSRSLDMAVSSFDWSMNEYDYALNSYVTPTLSAPTLGSAVLGASAWFRDPNEDDVTVYATVFYSAGRPTSIKRTLDALPQTGGWGKFDFKDAIDPKRKIVGLVISADLDLDVDDAYDLLSYDGTLLIDDVSLTVPTAN